MRTSRKPQVHGYRDPDPTVHVLAWDQYGSELQSLVLTPAQARMLARQMTLAADAADAGERYEWAATPSGVFMPAPDEDDEPEGEDEPEEEVTLDEEVEP